MAIKIIDYGSPEYYKMIDLRKNILRNPLGIDFAPAELEREKDDILIGCFDDEKLEGCCLLTEIAPKTVRLRQMAVTNGLQGKGIGRVLMNFAENIARDRGYRTIKMHSRKTSIGFFEKLGYHVAGDEFQEITIPHFVMEKDL